MQVLGQMKRSKVRPDTVIYNMLLSGYGRQGDVQNAFKIFNEVCVCVCVCVCVRKGCGCGLEV